MQRFPQVLRSARRKPLVVSIAAVVVLSALVCAATVRQQKSHAAPPQQPPSLSNAKALDYVPGEILVRFSDKRSNGAFVAMQYYGYLRRTPEPEGYQNWLNYLNAHPTDFRTMVNGFVNSFEYRLRFGRP